MSGSIPDKLYYKIGEVSEISGVEPYVLRYWESEFKIINPIRSRSKQRLYKRRDLELVLEIKKLLYEDRFTIEGAKKVLQKKLKNRGKQLELNLDNDKYKKLLDQVCSELKSIKELLK